MSLEAVTNGMRDKVGNDCGLGATVKFDFGGEGVIYLDASKVPNEVSNENKDADCTLRISLDDFKEMAAGELDPTMAFMMGKLKIDGSMGIAMKLGKVLG
ncbi:MAG: SCP2 sterol-binding domain-containing protein [Alphaproteobacteria bacterium]|nr:SCP2 sterol-binding domain-containing protein [Alphaproteobacteria bacterium]